MAAPHAGEPRPVAAAGWGEASRRAAREKKRFERNNEMTTKLMKLVVTARRAVRNLALFAAVAAATGVWAGADTETVGDYTWMYIYDDTAEIVNGAPSKAR